MPDAYVVKHPKGWAIKQAHQPEPISVHRTQNKAEKAAKEHVKEYGGGEVRVQNRQGKWRDSDTVPPGNDPYPPRDRK